MKIITPVEERIKTDAMYGIFFAHVKISKTKAEVLRQEGLTVTDLHDSNKFPRTHYISWKEAKVECEDVSALNEKSDTYTFAQQLWIISKKSQPKSK